MGSRPCFADSRPVNGRAPGQPGLWLAYGHGHSGLTLGPVNKVTTEGLPKMSHHANDRGFPHFYPEMFLLKRGDLHQKVDHFDVTPMQIIQGVARAADELRLPHSVHIHCNNLGMPGNWQTTLETMKAFDGHRAHITHAQFHSYGGGEGDENTFNSKTLPLTE